MNGILTFVCVYFQALAALRTALKKERGNSRLYSQIIDMCYQRHPIDVNGKHVILSLCLLVPAHIRRFS
jgi:hypothetical protein